MLYLVEDPGGTPTSRKVTGNRYAGLLLGALCQGRLTTESGVPVSTSDRTAQGTLYWKPCTPSGTAMTTGYATFYDGTRYVLKPLTQLSLDLSTAEAGGAIDDTENYDVFLDYNAGTPALVIGPQWTDATTRATALATQGQLTVLTGDTDWTWVGTIRASGSGTTEDSAAKRFVWNAHNQRIRPLTRKETTANWTYASATLRQANDNALNQVEVVNGLLGACAIDLTHALVVATGGTSASLIGIGEDSTTASAAACLVGYLTVNTVISAVSVLRKQVPLGYHKYTWIEGNQADTGTTTYYQSATSFDAGMSGTVEC